MNRTAEELALGEQLTATLGRERNLRGECSKAWKERDAALALAEENAKYRDVAIRLETMRREEQADVARLRALIKMREWSAGFDAMDCPWCGGTSDTPHTGHRPDCPAFTPGGEVR